MVNSQDELLKMILQTRNAINRCSVYTLDVEFISRRESKNITDDDRRQMQATGIWIPDEYDFHLRLFQPQNISAPFKITFHGIKGYSILSKMMKWAEDPTAFEH